MINEQVIIKLHIVFISVKSFLFFRNTKIRYQFLLNFNKINIILSALLYDTILHVWGIKLKNKGKKL